MRGEVLQETEVDTVLLRLLLIMASSNQNIRAIHVKKLMVCTVTV